MREPIIKGNPEEEPSAQRGGRREERPADMMDEKLRPQRLDEVIGQRSVAERLEIALQASQ